MKYVPNSAPGTYDHRGLWCLRCDQQTSHWRPYKKHGIPWRCTNCGHVEGEPWPPAEPKEPEKAPETPEKEPEKP